MKIFLSWSGVVSQKEADLFDKFIGKVLSNMSVETFYSPNIGKGKLWEPEIFDSLKDSSYGFIFVTEDNCDSPWLNYEAGALDAGLLNSGKKDAKIVPIILDQNVLNKMQKISSPLRRFQCFNIGKFVETYLEKDMVPDKDELFGIFRDVLGKMGMVDYDTVQRINETYHDYLPEFIGNLAKLRTNEDSVEPEEDDKLAVNPAQNEYMNFKNMLSFWIEQTKKNIENTNGSRVRFGKINDAKIVDAQKVFLNPQFKVDYLSFSNSIRLVINFFASGQYKGKNVNFVTARGEGITSNFLNIVYVVDESKLWVVYKDDPRQNIDDSDELRVTMQNKGYTAGKYFNIKALGLEKQDKVISNELKELFDYFYEMVQASKI